MSRSKKKRMILQAPPEQYRGLWLKCEPICDDFMDEEELQRGVKLISTELIDMTAKREEHPS